MSHRTMTKISSRMSMNIKIAMQQLDTVSACTLAHVSQTSQCFVLLRTFVLLDDVADFFHAILQLATHTVS